jgi:hypothetical protein
MLTDASASLHTINKPLAKAVFATEITEKMSLKDSLNGLCIVDKGI